MNHEEGYSPAPVEKVQRPRPSPPPPTPQIARDSQEVMQSKVDVFNEKHPVGSSVTVVKDLGEEVDTTVKYPAQILSGHTPVVWLKGISGCYRLDRVIG